MKQPYKALRCRIELAACQCGWLPLAVLLLLATTFTPLLAADWPVVRGDNHGTGFTKTQVPAELEVLWTYKAKEDAGFDATAVIKNGIVYIGDSAGTLHAIRLVDKSVVWTKDFPEMGFAAGAAIDEDRLYIGDLDGVVRCLSIADGSELWSYKLEAEVFAGPTPLEDSVLVTSEVGTLVCLNKADGKERWTPFHIDAPLRCTPTVADGRAMLAGCDSLLHVINVADGQQLHTLQIDGPTGATPAMQGGRVFFGTEGGTFYAIDVPADGSKPPAVAWTYRDKQRGQPIRAAAAITENIVVYGSQGKAIYGLDPNTGNEKWKVVTRARVESSPVLAGNRVIVATTAGKLYVLGAADGAIQYENDFGGGFTASPAVVDGRIVIGNTDGTLYCLGAKPKSSN